MNKYHIVILATVFCVLVSATAINAITWIVVKSRLAGEVFDPLQESQRSMDDATNMHPAIVPKHQMLQAENPPENKNPLLILDQPVQDDSAPSPSDTREEIIARTEKATCFLSVRNYDGKTVTGSAFVVFIDEKRTILATHAEIVMSQGSDIENIQCFFKPGTADVREVNAKIIHVFKDSDIALLETPTVYGTAALDVTQTIEANETLPVLAFGFPFDKRWARDSKLPGVSVSSGTITSIRMDDTGKTEYYQVDCPISPGSAGGPVISEDGKLIGIIYSKVKNSDIGFMIPTDALAEAFAGSITNLTVQDRGMRNGKKTLHVQLQLFDPHKEFNGIDVLTFQKRTMRNEQKVGGEWVEASDEWNAVRMGIDQGIAFQELMVPPSSADLYFQIRAERKTGTYIYLEPKRLDSIYAPGRDSRDDWQWIKLPNKFSDVDLAGGGRYLIFHLEPAKKLLVFDTRTREIKKELDLPGDGLCAAGAKKIVFLHKATKNLLRWDLDTFELERTSPLDYPYSPTVVVLGHSSNGPLLVGGGDSPNPTVCFFNLDSLEEYPIPGEDEMSTDLKSTVRVSGNGSLFTTLKRNYQAHEAFLFDPALTATGKSQGRLKFPPKKDRERLQYSLPNHDGSLLFTNTGIFTQIDKSIKNVTWSSFWGSPLPAAQGRFFVSLGMFGSFRNPHEKRQMLSIHHESILGALLPRLELPIGEKVLGPTSSSDAFTLDQRVYWIPDEKVLAILPRSNDRVLIRRFDMDIELADSLHHYLFVASEHPRYATAGKTMTYKMIVKSRREIASFKVLSGQDGMTVSGEGELTWTPSENDVGNQVVRVSITDDRGMKILYAFSLFVEKGT